MYGSFHVSNNINRLVSDYLNGVDQDRIEYYLQSVMKATDTSDLSELQNHMSSDPVHHYIMNLLKENDIYLYSVTNPKVKNLVEISGLYFEHFQRSFSKIMNSNGSMDPNVLNDFKEHLYMALAYYIIGYTVLIHYIPICLTRTSSENIKETEMELYGQLIGLYKNEFYFNNIRASVEDYINEFRSKNSGAIKDEYFFPKIKKRKSTKSYLTDYGPDFYDSKPEDANLDNAPDVAGNITGDIDEVANNVHEFDIQKDLPTISAKSLQKYLQSKDKNVLLVDLRSREDFNTNHINNKFLLNIDPQLLLGNKGTMTEESLEKTLRKIFKNHISEIGDVDIDEEEDRDSITIRNNFNYYKQRHKFNLIVYYTDNNTWSEFNNDAQQFDYLKFFFDLIYKDKTTNSLSARKLMRAPKCLENGFAGWLSLLEMQNVGYPDDDSSPINLSPNDFGNYYIASPTGDTRDMNIHYNDNHNPGYANNSPGQLPSLTPLNQQPIGQQPINQQPTPPPSQPSNNNYLPSFSTQQVSNSIDHQLNFAGDERSPVTMSSNQVKVQSSPGDPASYNSSGYPIDYSQGNPYVGLSSPEVDLPAVPPPIPKKNSVKLDGYNVYNNPPRETPPPVPSKPKAPLKPRQLKSTPANLVQTVDDPHRKFLTGNVSKNNSPVTPVFASQQQSQARVHNGHYKKRNSTHITNGMNQSPGYKDPPSPAYPAPNVPAYPAPGVPVETPPQQSLSAYEAAKEMQSGKKRKPPPPPVAVTVNSAHNQLNGSKTVTVSPAAKRFPVTQAITTPSLQPPQQASQIIAAPHRPLHHQRSPLRSKIPVNGNGQQQQQIAPATQKPQKPQNILKQYNIVGLKNYEYNCYINCLLQCIFSYPRFRDLFLGSNYKKYSAQSKDINAKKPVISRAVGRLFDKMYAHGGLIIAPTNFLKVCSSVRPDFRIPYQQQDTAEFLIFLLDTIHEELKGSEAVINEFPETTVPALNYRDITEFDTSSRLSMNVTDEEIRGYTKWFQKVTQKTGISPVSALFQGQLESCLRCVKCSKVSKTFANFSVLSLPILQQSFNKKKIRLEDCIKLFTADEVLSGENAWDCPNCKRNRAALKEANSFYNSNYGNEVAEDPEAAVPSKDSHQKQKTFFNRRGKKKEKHPQKELPITVTATEPGNNLLASAKDKYNSIQITGNKTIKSLKFIQLPRVLVLGLSRFKFNKYGEHASKDTSSIIFPINLDIKVKDEILTYRLFAYINHFGSLRSGHYTSTVNKRPGDNKKDCWCYFDDENFEVGINPGMNYSDNTITSNDVYVLFYSRVDSII